MVICMRESEYVKIIIGVPIEAADAVREAIGKAGGGEQGSYDFCSFSSKGTGRFRPLAGANPAVGEIGKLEAVEEEKIETICHKDLVEKVIAAIKLAHPYEEPAIDIFPRLEI
jgi:hypothetical protein